MNFILQILQTVLLISFVIGVAWVTDKVWGKKAGYRWRKVLWLVLAVRLLLPFQIHLGISEGPIHPVRLEVNIPYGSFAQFTKADEGLNYTDESQNIEAKQAYSENEEKADAADSVSGQENELADKRMDLFMDVSAAEWIICIWAIGAVLIMGVHCFQYYNVKKKYLAASVSCDEEEIKMQERDICEAFGMKKVLPVRIMQETHGSPMLFGYFHTVLLLPNITYDRSELDLIMRHELTHYKAKDLWYKLFLVTICDIYWFNPIFRLMKNMAFRDVEYVCDEKTTKDMDLNALRSYSNTILKTMSGGRRESAAFTTQFAETKKNMKQRIENIFSSHSRKVGIGALCLSLIVLVTGTVGVYVTIEGNSEEEIADAAQIEQKEPEQEEIVAVETQTVEKQTEEIHNITVDAALLNPDDTELMNSWKEAYPNYEIGTSDNYFQWTDEFFEQMPTAFYAPSAQAMVLAKDNETADITDVLSQRGWLEQMDDDVKAMISDENGRVYGIPYSAYNFGLAVNVELFKETGLTDEQGEPVFPSTWEELAQDAVKIKEKTGQAGFCLISDDIMGAVHFYNLAWDFGATTLDTAEGEQNGDMGLDSEDAIQAMEFVKDLKWKYDVLTEDPTTEDYISGFEHLANGTAAMFIAPSDSFDVASAYGLDVSKIVLGALPAGPDGAQYSYYNGGTIVFSADAEPEEIDAVVSLLEMQGIEPIQEKMQIPGELKAGSAIYQSELALEISSVLHSVVTEPDADVTELMQKANENWKGLNEIIKEK